MADHAASGGGAIILVVDDDALITLNTVDQLNELGHIAIEAFSGRDALAVLAGRDDIDLMITDYSMPGMNGVELATAARAIRPDLKVMLATGYAELPGDAPVGLLRLEKPFREEELAARLREVIAS